MTTWAIVPVKPLKRGKSRLAGAMTIEQRTALNQYLLAHTLSVLKSVPEIDRILVISRDPAALARAREDGALTIQEQGRPRLNFALDRATLFTRPYNLHAVLVLPVDLPLLNAADLELVFQNAPASPGVVIVPDRHNLGTNALWVSPPGLIAYQFGPGSFQLHSEAAQQAGARLVVLEIPSLAMDIDLPEDLEIVRERIEVV